MAFKLCTIQQIKDRTKGGSGALGTDFDDLLNKQIIPAVTLQLAQFCRRPDWDKKERTEYFSPGSAGDSVIPYDRLYFTGGSRRLFVASPPIAASPVIKIWEDTNVPHAYGDDTLLVLDTDYFTLDAGILVKDGYAPWAVGIKTIKVTYTGGYLTADVTDADLKGGPADLVEACIIQSKIVFDRREAGGLASQSLQGGSFSYSAGLRLDPSVTDKLWNYRVWPGP